MCRSTDQTRQMGSNYTYGCGSNFKIPETTEAADDRTQTSYQKNKRMKSQPRKSQSRI